MFKEGTDASSVTEEQWKQVADDVKSLQQHYKLTKKYIAKAAGYSESVISEFLNGGYKGNNGDVAINLDSWLVEEEARRARPATTQFVWTEVAKSIRAVADFCSDKRKIGLIHGPDTSGLGKTMALTAISQQLGPRRCTLVTIDKVDANPTGLLRKICSAMHVQDSGSNRQRFERLVEELKGSSHLLLIDQAHNLRGSKEDKPFYILTDLYDATGTAQLWCGTSDLVAYLQKQQIRQADESLAQIRRRIYPVVDLMEKARSGDGGTPLVTVDQVKEMFARNTMKLTTSAARFLCQLCNLPDSGAVGFCVSLVEYATCIAEMNNLKAIDTPQLVEAMQLGLTRDRAMKLMARLPEQTIQARKAG